MPASDADQALRSKRLGAATALLAVAVIQAVGIALVYPKVEPHLGDPRTRGVAWIVLSAQVAFAGVFFALWAWARRSPLPAAVVGLSVFLAVVLAGAIANPRTLVDGAVLNVLSAFVLVKGVQAAVAHRRLAREAAGAAGATVTSSAGP